MNKFILFLLLLSLIAFAKEPKFHFKDCVITTSGFYRGCKGEVESLNPNYGSNEDTYDVRIDSCRGDNSTSDRVTLKESELELCKK